MIDEIYIIYRYPEVIKCISAGKFKKMNVKMTNMKVEKTRQEGKL